MRVKFPVLVAAAALLLLALLAGCAAPAPVQTVEREAAAEPTPTAQPTATPDPGYEPVFEPAECRFPHQRDWNVECGDLIVPEDRADPDGPSVRLHVAVFKSRSINPAPDPVIHLVGGPGASLLDKASFYLEAGGNEILARRDYIMFNQRGTAYAEPQLTCPGYELLQWRAAEEDLSQEAYDEQAVEVLRECREAFAQQGIDLSAYNSVENAADVEDLRRALGYEQVNLYGISYGSRLALTVMRYYPDSVRSAILDAVYPPQVDLYSSLAANADRVLDTLFMNCSLDEACRQAYDGLEQSFLATVHALDEDPIVMPVGGPDQQYIVQLDGEAFVEMVFNLFYENRSLPFIPGWIEAAQNRDSVALLAPLQLAMNYSNDWGMYMSVQCRDEVAFETREGMAGLAAEVPPGLAEVYATETMFRVCEMWNVGGPDAVENQPVKSDIPTLLFAGEYDPITPPAWAHLAAETLPNSTVYEFPGTGHGVMRSNECALSMGLDFLDDPTSPPDASCMDALEVVEFH